MRCPGCGAHNADHALWCGQCYGDLRSDPPRAGRVEARHGPVPVGTGGPGLEGRDDPEPGPASPHSSRPRLGGEGGTEGRIRRTEEGVDWRCAVCDEWSPLETTICGVCGTGFAESLRRPRTDAAASAADVTESTALLASAVLPGIAHWWLGRQGTAIARGLTYLLWLTGGISLLRAAAGTGLSIVPGAIFVAGALAIWCLTLLDALTLARGHQRELLTGRVLLWLVVGVLGGVMLAFLPSASGLP